MPLTHRGYRRAGTALLLASLFCARGQDAWWPERWLSKFGGGFASIVALDREGQIYVAGTGQTGLPVTSNAFAPTAPDPRLDYGFLLKLDPSGTSILYGTFIPGVTPHRMVVDEAGYAYVLGDYSGPGEDYQWLSHFPPITPNAAQPQAGLTAAAVVVKIAPGGELTYATFAGGMWSSAGGLAVDGRGRAVVCGATGDRSLPVTPSVVQALPNRGAEAYVGILSADGSRFESLTYFGGTGADGCEDLKLDADGSVLLFGDTNSRQFPTTAGAYQTTAPGLDRLYVAKIDPRLERLIWCTLVGGTGRNRAQFLALIPESGDIVLAGTTDSPDFPSTPGSAPGFIGFEARPFIATLHASGARLVSGYVLPFKGNFASMSSTAAPLFAGVVGHSENPRIRTVTLNAADWTDVLGRVMRFDPAANIPTYLSATLTQVRLGVAAAPNGRVIAAGFDTEEVTPSGLPVRSLGGDAATWQRSGILELSFEAERLPLVTQVVNAASLVPAPVAPGELVEIRGAGLCSSEGTRVLADGTPLPIVTCGPRSLIALAPLAFADANHFTLAVERDGVSSDARKVEVADVDPALFTAANTGSGPALAINEGGGSNSPQQPAQKGRRLRLLATGLGATGEAQITASISGIPATVERVVPAADGIGRVGVDIVVPPGVPSGDFLPVLIRAGTAASQPGVTVAIR